MTVINKNKILSCWKIQLFFWLKLIVFFKERMQGWMELALRLFGDLNFYVEFFLITGWCYVSIKDKMPLISCFVVNNINFSFFRIKYKLRILFKGYFLRIIFIQVKLIAFDFLLWNKGTKWWFRLFFIEKVFFEFVSL